LVWFGLVWFGTAYMTAEELAAAESRESWEDVGQVKLLFAKVLICIVSVYLGLFLVKRTI